MWLLDGMVPANSLNVVVWVTYSYYSLFNCHVCMHAGLSGRLGLLKSKIREEQVMCCRVGQRLPASSPRRAPHVHVARTQAEESEVAADASAGQPTPPSPISVPVGLSSSSCCRSAFHAVEAQEVTFDLSCAVAANQKLPVPSSAAFVWLAPVCLADP